MGNTVRTFSSLGAQEPEKNLRQDSESLGDTLERMGEKERLGDFLAEMSSDDGVDAVETVREGREEL